MRYKTIMFGMNSYNKLASAKRAMRERSGLKLSFEDLILDLVSRKLDLAPIDDRLKRYIEKAALQISNIEGIEGILLFGSVAKGIYNKYSDIDVAVVTCRGKFDTLEDIISLMIKLKEGEDMMKLGLPSLISPIVLSVSDLNSFRPFYFDLADFGIILYERGTIMTNFVNSMKWKKHHRETVRGIEVLTW